MVRLGITREIQDGYARVQGLPGPWGFVSGAVRSRIQESALSVPVGPKVSVTVSQADGRLT